MKYSIDWLKGQVEANPRPEFLFFWGHTQKKIDVVDKSCFSQWFPSAFVVNGITYRTAEHWMMAKKAELFNDLAIAQQILDCEKPGLAKELGRKVKGFDPKFWSDNAYEIVVEGNKYKFEQHQELASFLLYTGDKVIVEASPVDPVWGIGLSADQLAANNPFEWKGQNLLGFALMEVRDYLKKE